MQINLTVSAGISAFENPTLVHRDNAINLNNVFVHSPHSMQLIPSPATYEKYGICKGDWLLVDAALQPLMSDLVLVENHDETFVVEFKKYRQHQMGLEDCDPTILLGVISLSVHHYRKPVPLPVHANLVELDIHQFLIERELSTVLCRAKGESMLPYIFNDDIMILERHLTPISGDVCVIALNHELVCKRIDVERSTLYSDNAAFKPYKVNQEKDYLRMHGVVRYALRLIRGIHAGDH